MPNEEFSPKWLHSRATVTREDLGTIVAEEIARSLVAAKAVDDDDGQFAGFMKMALAEFGARIAARVFAEHSITIGDEEEE